jgi:hypothetical protein
LIRRLQQHLAFPKGLRVLARGDVVREVSCGRSVEVSPPVLFSWIL